MIAVGPRSDENIELVRAAWEAFVRGDLVAALANAHPDAVAFRAPPLPDPQTYRGRAGVLQMYADWTAPFSDFEMEALQFIGAGDRVVVEVLQRGRGRTSGVIVEGRFWFVYTIAARQIIRQDVFNTRAQALEAAGLGGQ